MKLEDIKTHDERMEGLEPFDSVHRNEYEKEIHELRVLANYLQGYKDAAPSVHNHHYTYAMKIPKGYHFSQVGDVVTIDQIREEPVAGEPSQADIDYENSTKLNAENMLKVQAALGITDNGWVAVDVVLMKLDALKKAAKVGTDYMRMQADMAEHYTKSMKISNIINQINPNPVATTGEMMDMLMNIPDGGNSVNECDKVQITSIGLPDHSAKLTVTNNDPNCSSLMINKSNKDDGARDPVLHHPV
jgi:hypothetical protein